MLPDRVSNPGPLTYESGALPIALRGPARNIIELIHCVVKTKMLRKKVIGINKIFLILRSGVEVAH